jgi:hypothetical protein
MNISPVLLLVSALLLSGCSKKQEAAAASKTNEPASGNPITAPVDYLGAIAKAKKMSEKTIDATSMNQAIQLFYAQEDRFPKDLNELVTKHYIASLPPPPAGSRYVYNPQTGAISFAKEP